MTIEDDIRTVLLTFSEVTDLVGAGASARIRPDRLHHDDDETLQHVIIEVDNETPQNGLDGLGGLLYSEVTLRCRGRTKALARALAEAIRLNGTDPGTGLAGYAGTVNSHTLNAVLDDQTTAFEPDEPGRDEGMYTIYANYVLSAPETV